MTDDLERLRRSRPDRLLPDDPPDPEVLAREKARLMAAITEPGGAAGTGPDGVAERSVAGRSVAGRSVAGRSVAGRSVAGRGAAGDRRMPSIYPRLAYLDELAALEFLTRAFGLVERRESRMEHPDGMLAWLELGDGVVMIGRAGEERHGLHSPLDAGASTAMVNAYVHDIDAHYRQAKAEGARIVTPLEDMFWGDRRYEALDLEGHRWHFAERMSAIRPRRPSR
jgi:uncharacterized glyoxalase superfamily protein PhnB